MANSTSAAIPGRTSKHWPRRLGIGLGLVMFVLWLLPTLLAHTPVLAWLVSRATKNLNGTVQVGSASCGWFSPIVLRDVTVRDTAGDPLMMIPTVKSERNLLDLLLNTADLGRFHCANAALELVCSKEATNLEKALANFLTSKAEAGQARPEAGRAKPSSPFALALDFKEARVTVHDGLLAKPWVLEPVTIHLGLNQANAPALQLKVQAVVAGASPGLLQTELTLDSTDQGKTALTGRVDNFPMALAAPVLRRFAQGIRLEGRVNGRWDLNWSRTTGRFEGELLAQDCLASGPLLGEDRLRLAQMRMPWKVAYDGQHLIVDKAEIVCDVGQITIQGTIDRTKGPLVRHEGPDLNLALDVDLARLVERLPGTLRLRPDTTLVAGRLMMACKGTVEPDGAVVWRGKADATEVRGVRAGQNLSWPKPLALAFQVRQTENSLPSLEQLRSESEFLKLDADGSGGQFTVMASVDLSKLTQPLEQFFDLSDVRLAGTAGAELTLLHKQPDCFQVAGGGFLRSFHCSFGKSPPWREEALKLTFHGDGKNLPSGEQRLDSGYLRLESGEDLFEAQLVDSVANSLQGPWGNVNVKMSGDLARWQDRVRPWSEALAPWRFRGITQTQAKVRWANQGIEYAALTTSNRDFQCSGPGVEVREPTFDLHAASGRFALEKFNVAFKDMVLRCPSLVMSAPGIHVTELNKNLVVTGTAAVQGDFERLRQWFPGVPALGSFQPPNRPAAALQQAGFQQISPAAFNGNVNVANLVIGAGAKPKWRDAQGDIGMSWNALKAYGCDVGPGKVTANLNAGWLRWSPVATTLNGGQVRLCADLRLDPGPMELEVAKGLLVERAQLTPEMCSGALGYAIPALAGVAEVQGLVSLSIESGHLDLADMTKSDLKGTLSLHSAKIGTGPLVGELNGLLRSPSPASLVKETQVTFQVVKGRVHHQNFELAFPDFTIRTSGSVGMDGTLALVAEMPVPPRWLVNNPLAATLAKQTIRLPIGGTIDHPRLDPQALHAANAEFLRNATSDVLRQGLDGQLLKLLGGR